MLAAVAAADLVEIDWKGQRIQAVEGQWIVNFQRPTPTVSRFGDVTLNDVFTGAEQPNAKTRPAVQALAALGVTFERYLGVEHSFLVQTPRGVGAVALGNVLKALPGFDSIEPDAVIRGFATTPSDPNFGNQYGLNNTGQVYRSSPTESGTVDADIDAPEAWDYTVGSPSVVVAVLDTGINYSHQDLATNHWKNPLETAGDNIDNDGNGFVDDIYGYDLINADRNPVDDNGHGTAVAGVIAADNNLFGGTGVSWNSKVMAVKVLDAGNNGTISALNAGINYVVGLRNKGINVRVINASLGGQGTFTGTASAIQAASDVGILFVTAAGNNGPNNGTQSTGWNNDAAGQAIYPSSFSNANILSVAATTDDDQLAAFSNYGVTSVDVAAPGDNIFTTFYNTSASYNFIDGTSFSAPMVAGVAALAFSMKPDLTVDQVKTAIVSQGDAKSSLSGKVASGKRLNAFNTLNFIHNTYSAYNKTVIGDEGGAPRGDDWLLEVSGSDTLIKKYQSGSYATIATVANSASKRIGVFGLGGNDYVTVGTGVLNTLYVNGGAGNDVLQGGGGNDSILGEAGSDAILGNGGADSILGGEGQRLHQRRRRQ